MAYFATNYRYNKSTMLSFLKKLFGVSDEPVTDFKMLMANGATIIDVRTTVEFGTGHILIAKNIPIDKIPKQLSALKDAGKPVITCCKSGTRSAVACATLQEAGIESYNGGGWQSLRSRIQ
jgi:phage shock protein E